MDRLRGCPALPEETGGTMSARAIWKGVLQLDDHAVPVKLYSALQSARVSFRLLSRKDSAPVRQAMVNPKTLKVVESEETRRAVVSGNRLVELTADELASLEPSESRDISLHAFVPDGALDYRWFERPYWLGPDEDPAAWSVLCAALAGTGLTGIASWVMRRKRYVGALRLLEGRPMLVTLRNRAEVVELDTSSLRDDSGIDPKQLAMAQQLISMLEGDFEHESLVDEYRESVLDMIDSKKAGKTVKAPEADDVPPVADLTRALEESLRQETSGAG